MTSYDPGTPLPFDIPSESQDEFLMNFEELNNQFGVDHIPFGNTITLITNTNPSVITSTDHLLVTGNTIKPSHIAGLSELNVVTPWSINGTNYAVTVIDANTFSIPVDTTNLTDFPPYIADSGDYLVTTAGFPYGFHKKNTFATTLQSPPNLLSPKSSLFTQSLTNGVTEDIITQLMFQDGVGNSFIDQLTNSTIIEGDAGVGFKTPWGIIINFGMATFNVNTASQDFEFPFISSNPPLYLQVTPTQFFTGSNAPKGRMTGQIVSGTVFTVFANVNPIVFNWFSIGF